MSVMKIIYFLISYLERLVFNMGPNKQVQELQLIRVKIKSEHRPHNRRVREED